MDLWHLFQSKYLADGLKVGIVLARCYDTPKLWKLVQSKAHEMNTLDVVWKLLFQNQRFDER